MRLKKSSIAFLIETLVNTYVIWLSSPHYKLWRLNKTITQEIKNLHNDICFEFAHVFRRDGVLVLSVYDFCYKVLSPGNKSPAVTSEVIFVRCRDGQLTYLHVRSQQDVYNFAEANPQCSYFVVSAHTIKVFRILDSIGEHVYYLNNFFDIFQKSYLPVFFRNILEKLDNFGGKTGNAATIVDSSDMFIEVVESPGARTYHIDLKYIGRFSHTTYTGKPGDKLQFFVDMKYIFSKNIEAIGYSLSKGDWLERYIKDVVEYLYSRDMIFTKDACKYPDMVPSLFPFTFVNLSTGRFKDGEMVCGGVCFSNVLEKSRLVGLVNRGAFEKYDECIGTLFFTDFVRMRQDRRN